MRSIVLYMHMHQPYRVKNYNIFSVGHDHDYWTEKDWYSGTNNKRIFEKVAKKSYIPMLAKLGKCLEEYPKFRFSLSLTGDFVEQAQAWAPEVIEALQKLVATGRVEIAAETYYHSLAFFYDREEFEAQVEKHREMVRELFGVTPAVFRNTELAYNNDLAKWCDEHGYKGVMAEGWDKVLEGRTPNAVYRPEDCKYTKLLCKNYHLSDDIAFRFADKTWSEWPLTADKYLSWLEKDANEGPIINLFMDFETFGENIWEDTGIFDFFEEVVRKWCAEDNRDFMTLSEACDGFVPAGTVSMPWTVTWADEARDLSAWLGNSMQHEAMKNLYDLREDVLATKDKALIADWRRLSTSDHPYYMSTKYLNDGSVHGYFSPYDSPFDAFLYYMNVLRDIRERVEEHQTLKSEE